MAQDLAGAWPLVDLRVRAGDLELRYANDSDLTALAELAREGIHEPDVMPFSTPWTDAPPEERARSTLQWHWRSLGEWKPESWMLDLATVVAGQVVGVQGVKGTDFGVTRVVETGSWLGRAHQGLGIGTRMRRAVLHLAFEGLGAREARSGAFEDNVASLRVSEKVGYRPDGTEVLARRGEPATIRRLVLGIEDWTARAHERAAMEIAGLEPCLALFGAV
ncbi:MAG: GNAT family N-acetyltransferase [Acidimicrobiales bacterium]